MSKRFRAAYWVGLMLALPIWNGCQSSKNEEHANAQVADKPAAVPAPVAQPNAVALRALPLLKGAWVKADYLMAILRGKSPLKSFDLAGPVSEILINPAELTGDSLVTTVGLGNHEGGNITVYFRPGTRPAALPTNYQDYGTPGSFAELSYRLGPEDTTLLLTTYSKNKKVLSQDAYKRVRGVKPGQLDALTVAVRRLLFVGNYVGTDSLGRPVRMQFTDKGTVKGLKGFKTYYVNTDFGGGPGNDIDHLVLDINTRHQQRMGYSHSGDTLRLYVASLIMPKTEDDVETLVRGRLLFTLIRH